MSARLDIECIGWTRTLIRNETKKIIIYLTIVIIYVYNMLYISIFYLYILINHA